MTSGLTGILYASIEMCRRLEEAGHQITYASPSDVKQRVTASQLDYVQLTALQEIHASVVPNLEGRSKWAKLWYRIKNRKKLRQLAIEQLQMDNFGAILDQLAPDLVVIDLELHPHIMAVFAKGIPLVLLSQWFTIWNNKGTPPLSRSTIPNIGWKGSNLGLKWAWRKIKVERYLKFSKIRLFSIGLDRRSVLRQYARQVGFPLKYIRENYWPGPFTYSTLPVISITIEQMEFPHKKRPNLHYVGAMINHLRNNENLASNESQLEYIFRLRKEKNKKLIYCSVSSMKAGDQLFLEKLLKSVKKNTDWLLIISLGGKLKQNDFSKVPRNVYLFSWVSQVQVLSEADCSINHGGIHTINECVYFKVPMLVYSGKKADQNGCAARIHYHQLGIMADKDQDRPEEITKKIEEVLRNPVYKANLEKMNKVYHSYIEERQLEHLVSYYLDLEKLDGGMLKK
ncbi:MAG: glycosyltransferase [Bacteroidota bacterium]